MLYRRSTYNFLILFEGYDAIHLAEGHRSATNIVKLIIHLNLLVFLWEKAIQPITIKCLSD